MIRLLIIPVFIYFLAVSPHGSSSVAGALFLAASVTDWLDGQVARRTRTISEFGAFADPLADQLLIASALVILLVKHTLPSAAVMIILVRDAYILAGYYLLSRRGVRVPVSMVGNGGVFWAGVGLSLASAALYTRAAIRQFRRPRPGVAGTD
jgi:CDP-diacylglycerol--glycerol-3-phosphate 3-phosphatidyltransferase